MDKWTQTDGQRDILIDKQIDIYRRGKKFDRQKEQIYE